MRGEGVVRSERGRAWWAVMPLLLFVCGGCGPLSPFVLMGAQLVLTIGELSWMMVAGVHHLEVVVAIFN